MVDTDELRIVLVTKRYAERLWDVGASFAWSDCLLTGNDKEIACRTETEDFCMEWMVENRPVYSSGLLEAEESYDEARGIYRLSGKFALPKPELTWKRTYVGDDLVLTTKVSPALLEGASDVVLTMQHDGMIGKAFLNGKLISDHSFGRFLPWEIGLTGELTGEAELKIVCQRATGCQVALTAQAEKKITFA